MKKTLLVLLLVFSLVLSGCSLVVKDPQVDLKQIVLDINGRTVDKQSLLRDYNYEMNSEYQMQQFYQMYGMQPPEIDPQAVLTRARDNAVRRIIIEQKAAELKLDALSDTEQEEVAKQVETTYQFLLDQVKAQYFADTALEGEALTKELQATADSLGQTRALVEEGVRQDFIAGKLEGETVKDVLVSDEDVKADYDKKVEENKTAYETDPDAYGTAVNGGSQVYYAPAGYRFVKQVLVKFLAEDQTVIDTLSSDNTAAQQALSQAQVNKDNNDKALAVEGLKEEDRKALTDSAAVYQAVLDEALAKAAETSKALEAARESAWAKILPKAQEIYERAKTDPFDDLVKEFNEDSGMPATGYAIRKDFASFDASFVLPAMALANPGDVAEPSAGQYGYYIVQYAAAIPEGPVDFEGVRQALHDALLSAKKTETWEAEITKWTQAAKITEYMDRMQD